MACASSLPRVEKFDPNLHQAMFEVPNPRGSQRTGGPGRAGWLCHRRTRAASGHGRCRKGWSQAGSALRIRFPRRARIRRRRADRATPDHCRTACMMRALHRHILYRGVLAGLALMAALAAVACSDRLDQTRVSLCRMSLPALNPPGSEIRIVRVQAGESERSIRIDYMISNAPVPGRQALATSGPRRGFIGMRLQPRALLRDRTAPREHRHRKRARQRSFRLSAATFFWAAHARGDRRRSRSLTAAQPAPIRGNRIIVSGQGIGGRRNAGADRGYWHQTASRHLHDSSQRTRPTGIGRCIASVRDLVDEVVLVDSGSRDETVAIARSPRRAGRAQCLAGATGPRSAFAEGQARNDWILNLGCG